MPTLVYASAFYTGAMFAFVIAHVFTRDRWPLLFLLSAAGQYLLAGVPIAALIGAVTGRLWLLLASLTLAIAWLKYWIRPLVATRTAAPITSGKALRVLSFNVLCSNGDAEGIAGEVLSNDPDIVVLQEPQTHLMERLAPLLLPSLPHAILRPGAAFEGMAIFSKLPLKDLGQRLADPDWVGPPIVASFEFERREVVLIGFHAAELSAGPRARERQVRAIAAFALHLDRPFLAAGDLNATPYNRAGALLNSGPLADAWTAAGRGPGFTFPGASKAQNPISMRPQLLGVPVPRWLFRIDYVVYSRAHWFALRSFTARSSELSDHRAVVTDLVFRNQET